VVEEEDKVTAAETAVAQHSAGLAHLADQGATQLVGESLKLEA
jgi:hypothetical protein